jgi:DNA-directed RNA polymerase subunit omega
MARITVEDCVTVVPNRFELCLVASNRAKSILSGAQTTFENKEKPAVISLREIAEDLVDVEAVKENIVNSIKNRGMAVAPAVVEGGEIADAIAEEGEVIHASLQEGTFINENVEVND